MKYIFLILLLSGCYPKITSPTGRVPKCKTHYLVSSTVPEKFIPEIKKAMKIWNDHYGSEVLTMEYPKDVSFRDDGIDSISWDDTWETRPRQEQARNLVYFRNGWTTESDIVINGKDFTYYVNKPKGNQVHFQSLMVHELGHTMGFNHVEDLGSVMQPLLGYNEIRLKYLPGGTLKCHP